MHQSIPSANIPPGNPRSFAPIFIPGPRDLCRLDCPGVARDGRTYYQSTKLLVDAAWRHFSATNWYTICWCSLVTRSVSKLGGNFKILSMVLKLKLEGMTKDTWTAFQFFSRFDFCKIPKFRRRLTGKADQTSKILPGGRCFLAPGAVLLQENFAPGQGFWPPQKISPGVCPRRDVRAWNWLMHYLHSSNNRHMSFQHRFLKEKTHTGDHLFFSIKELKLVKFKMF